MTNPSEEKEYTPELIPENSKNYTEPYTPYQEYEQKQLEQMTQWILHGIGNTNVPNGK